MSSHFQVPARFRYVYHGTAVALLFLGLVACDDQPAAAVGADKLITNLQQVRAGVEVRDAHETPIEGLVGVKVGAGNVIYGTPEWAVHHCG